MTAYFSSESLSRPKGLISLIISSHVPSHFLLSRHTGSLLHATSSQVWLCTVVAIPDCQLLSPISPSDLVNAYLPQSSAKCFFNKEASLASLA